MFSPALFRTAPLHVKQPASMWKIQRLRKSQLLCYNLPPYKGEITDRRFYYPMGVFYFNCQNPAAPIEDFIVARYRNRVKCQFSAEGEEFFSIMLASRVGVVNQLESRLAKFSTPLKKLPPSSDDWRTRFGFTASCSRDKELSEMTKILDCLNTVTELPDCIRQICTNLMMPPVFEERSPLINFTINENLSPPYFKYSGATLYWGGNDNRNFFEDEAILRTEIPPLHLAVLNNDLQTIQERLQQNPYEANLKDPWGVTAFDLIRTSPSEELVRLFLKAKHKISPTSLGDYYLLHNITVFYLNSDNRKNPRQIIKHEERLEKYKELIQRPVQQRSSLHIACINGDMQYVQHCLLENKHRLEEQDPRGFTPALLAAANGHAKLLRWLFEQGATTKDSSFEHPFLGKRSYRLIDNAASGEVMQVLLEHRVNPEEFNNHQLIQAIITNKIAIAKFLIYYLQTLPVHNGLNAVDLAIHLSPKNGPDMLRMLLMAYDNPVQTGPYDATISEAVGKLLHEHNQRYTNKSKRKLDCAKIMGDSIQEQKLISWFRSESVLVQSVIKSVHLLAENEKEALYQLFDRTFEMVNPEENKKNYFAEQIEFHEEKPGFINLFYLGNKLIAFFVFEIMQDSHPKVGEFILFHAKLGANEPNYSSHGWLALGFRTMTALDYKNKRVFTYAETIPPGLGLCGMLPPQVEFAPKFSLPQDFMEKVVSMTGEELKGKKIHTKVKINVRSVDSNNITLDYFKTMTNGLGNVALAVCYEVTPDVVKRYLEKVAPNGIGEKELKEFMSLWHKFIGEEDQQRLVARL